MKTLIMLFAGLLNFWTTGNNLEMPLTGKTENGATFIITSCESTETTCTMTGDVMVHINSVGTMDIAVYANGQNCYDAYDQLQHKMEEVVDLFR